MDKALFMLSEEGFFVSKAVAGCIVFHYKGINFWMSKAVLKLTQHT